MTNRNHTNQLNRCGAVAPLMALLLPVLLLICGVVINIAYMQLNRTELRVATDSAARAAGRAFSEFQNVDVAVGYAVTTGRMNNVGSKQFQLDPTAHDLEQDPDAIDEISFGGSTRLNNGYGRYEFHPKDRNNVRNKTDKATAIRIVGRRTSDSLGGSINMLFAGWGPFSQFEPVVASTATQVDRDIALVLDRSGSMLEYKDWDTLKDRIQEVRDDNDISYNEWYYGGRSNTWIGQRTYPYSLVENNWNSYKYHELAVRGYQDEWEYAKDMRDRVNSGDGQYARQYNTYDPAPRHSRWYQLDEAVNAFLDVLENTDQEERVAMITFNSSSTQNLSLSDSFGPIRTKVASIAPKNGTNISSGMQKGLDSIINVPANPNARPYAAKTIIVLTDGIHTSGSTRPPTKATSLVSQYNVIIHTVTFSTSVPQASKDEMKEVARIGGGKWYHADTGEQLVDIFEEIANNLPTIITE